MVDESLSDELPGYEKQWLKFSTNVAASVSSTARVTKAFERESSAILKIVGDLDVDQLSQPVKIPRLVGLRHSNCDWSILMVIDHVMRFNEWVLLTINALQSGTVESGRSGSLAQLDRFYPDQEVGFDCIDEYQEQVWRYSGFIALQKKLRASGTASLRSRPWLGTRNAFQWHCVSANHTKIHRRQIQKILAVGGVV